MDNLDGTPLEHLLTGAILGIVATSPLWVWAIVHL